jgi:pilus assembly protein FimV
MKPTAGKGPSSQSDSKSAPGSALEPPTRSEVQTKLDLARQFIDMGDPESARHMLDEVIEEGDATQKHEAKRLLDSLP